MIVKLLLVIILIYIIYRVVNVFRRKQAAEVRAYRINDPHPQGEDLVQDLYCGTYVPQSQAYTCEIEGQLHYFCSRECCEKYLTEKNKN